MFKQVYIVLFGIVLLVSFALGASLMKDDETGLDPSNQPVFENGLDSSNQPISENGLDSSNQPMSQNGLDSSNQPISQNGLGSSNQPISENGLDVDQKLPVHENVMQNSNRLSGDDGNSFTSSQIRFQQEMLQAHNNYRARHCSPPLQLDDNLSHGAQSFAEELASMNTMIQSNNKGVGQNMYTKTSSDNLDYVNGDEPTTSWYNGNRYYNFDQGGFSMETGSFTQLVWKASNLLGVGIAFTSDGHSAYIVAQYKPAGNYGNLYQQNVFPAQC